MPKSDFKLLVLENAPESVDNEKTLPASFPVVIDDIIVKLTVLIQALGKSTDMLTADDIVRRLYDPIVKATKHVPCYVCIFDKVCTATHECARSCKTLVPPPLSDVCFLCVHSTGSSHRPSKRNSARGTKSTRRTKPRRVNTNSHRPETERRNSPS